MNYEIVDLAEKTVVGVSAETSNDDPKMAEIIGGLWQQLYGENGVHLQINNKVYSVPLVKTQISESK